MEFRTSPRDEIVGAAMVVGGGVAGMQAALDLAESGIKVYLVESSPAIGGKMAQLDKTFPTNDCAMCTISPRLVECGRHLNIRILTNTTVARVDGEVGDFRVTVARRPRYVWEDRCTGCGECATACPVRLPDRYNEGLGERKAAYLLYPQAVPQIYTIEKKGTSPCKDACPAGCGAQGYIALIAAGRYQEALDLVRQTIPFPSVCGRVCTHRCETACRRAQVDEPVAIMSLKRFLSDWEFAQGGPQVAPVERTRKEKVAVIGGGPAGLTAAADLAKLGYGVTVFEALPVAGGMMSVGIPAYRLPKNLLQAEIDAIAALGVEIRTNTRVGSDIAFEDLRRDYQAIFVAVGAHRSARLGIEGEGLEGVVGGIDFLRQVNLSGSAKVGSRVVVIGGGDTAMDAARTALRLGAQEVTVLYRRSRAEMPASDWEVVEAEAEGVRFMFLVAPTAVKGEDGRATHLTCVRMKLGEPDASGRRRPIPIAGSDFILPVGTVIAAIGQSADLSFLPGELAGDGRLATHDHSQATGQPSIFAGGDVATGPATVVEAIAAGHRAARSIDCYLRGEELLAEPPRKVVEEPVDVEAVEKRPRQRMPVISEHQRLRSFDEVESGFTEEMARAEALRCLNCGLCSECYACERVCQAKAINHLDRGSQEELRVGAIILAPGYDLYDASLAEEFGYGRYPNVVTSMQLERLLSASGPTGGHVQRPSDGQAPRRIAFLQCIGSRDQQHPYCSTVCCMYATKEAMMAKEHEPDLDCRIFLTDVRAFGKGFEAYYQRAQEEHGVKYIRCRPSSLKEVPSSKNLVVRYLAEDGKLLEEEFDLVVLSVGMVPAKSAQELARTLGVELDEQGFVRAPSPLETSRSGVFACGPFVEPMDIPESVVQAGGAAAKASSILAPARGTLATEKVYPPEMPLDDQEPRIGVFICHCGSNIAGFVDVEEVLEYTRTLPGVVYAERNIYTCSQDTQGIIREKIASMKLNRLIVASCTPRTHEPLFQETAREAGLNPFLFEMANIRDQCSWVHSHDRAAATAKSKELVRMAVARARTLRPLHKVSLDVVPAALVIGGGVAGMNAALALSSFGYAVYLVERERQLGGNLRRLHYDVEGGDPQAYLSSLAHAVMEDDRIHVYTGATVVKSTGFVGNFKSTVRQGDVEYEVAHGVTIVATGGREYRGNEFLLGSDSRVLTQLELEEKLAAGVSEVVGARNIVMLQCVGPEEERKGYCSRICCTVAMKNALKIKEVNPAANIYVLYEDIRTYGFREQYYTAAREKGVVFFRHTEGQEPAVAISGGQLLVSTRDLTLGEEITIAADLLVLSTAVIPSEGNQALAEVLKVPLTKEGFFLEAHIKLRPVDFASEGIFLCGAAHYPKFIEESIAQAWATAARAATVLSKKHLEAGGVVASVESEKCAACLTCVRVCPYQVPRINAEGVAQIEPASCHGCGTCVAECPAKAIQLAHYQDNQIIVKSDALLTEAL